MKKFKKVILAVTFGLMLAVTAQSQDIKNDRGTFTKPAAGDNSIETSLSPNIVGGTIFSLNEPILQNLFAGIDKSQIDTIASAGSAAVAYFPLLRFRRFKSDKFAWRAMLNISYASNKTKDSPSGGTEVTNSNNSLGVGAGFGFEKHLVGAERLSTYIGVDAQVAWARYSIRMVATETLKRSQAGFAFGARGFAGMDYYFIPKVYLGVEVGYGLGINNYGKQKNSGPGQENGTDISSNIVVTPYVSPSFRFGWRF
jgi:hypothetical protein